MSKEKKQDNSPYLNIMHSKDVRVTYSQTDRMGFVYYANYLVWFEIGRTELLRDLNVTYKDIEDNGILLPVVKSECSYKSPAKYDDVITIQTKISEISKIGLTFSYTIIRPKDNKLIADGITKHIFVNKDGKILKIGEDFFRLTPKIEVV